MSGMVYPTPGTHSAELLNSRTSPHNLHLPLLTGPAAMPVGTALHLRRGAVSRGVGLRVQSSVGVDLASEGDAPDRVGSSVADEQSARGGGQQVLGICDGIEGG